MHVLQVHNHYRLPGGEDLVVERDTEALRDSGHQVTLYDTTNAVSAPSAIASLAIAPWNTVEASRLAEAVSRAQPDVVHFHNTWFRLSPSTIKAVSDLGVPTVMTLHNYRILCINGQRLRNGRTCDSCLTDGNRSALRHRCYQGSLPLSAIAAATRANADRKDVWSRHVDRFIAMTPATVDLFERWGFDPAHIVVRPHHFGDPGIRTSKPSESQTLLFVGRLEAAKGIELLCQSWYEGNRRLQLTVIGDGPQGDQLRSDYPDVEWMGQIPPLEVHESMKQARALAFPSTWEETFGNVVAEAMACGLPVVASSVSPISHHVRKAGDEWVFDVHDPDSLRRALELVEAGSAVDAASEVVRSIAADNFLGDGAPSLIDVYDQAIANRANDSAGVGK